jgi:CDP-glycerol glycerophosphotransferase (TagB/SpsB family)
MDNHIHLLVSGRYEDCLAFFAWILHRLARVLEKKHGISGILKSQASDVQAVTDREMFLNEVCYLLRNGYQARVDSPYSYPWVPFECYFNPYLHLIHGTPVPGAKEAKRMFGTHVKIPSDWEHFRGRILNKFFVDYRTVERKIGGSLEFFDRLRRFNLESIVEQEHGIEEKLLFTDTEMQEKIRAVCQNELHTESHHQLERKDLLWLARTLARRFASPKKQLARLLGIDLSILDQLL